MTDRKDIKRPSALTEEERAGIKKLLENFKKLAEDDKLHVIFFIEGMAAASGTKTSKHA